MGEPSLKGWRKTASPSLKPPAQLPRGGARTGQSWGAARTRPQGLIAVGDWPTVSADQSPEDVPGPEKPAYFFFFAAFFLVAFFFAAFFFAILESPPQVFRMHSEFARRNAGGGRTLRGRGGASAQRPSVAQWPREGISRPRANCTTAVARRELSACDHARRIFSRASSARGRSVDIAVDNALKRQQTWSLRGTRPLSDSWDAR